MPETQVWSLGWEDLLKQEMETQCSILSWETSWTEEPGGLQSMGSQKLRCDWATEHVQMDLEGIMLSEKSQEKEKYCVISLYVESKKNKTKTNEQTEQNRNRVTENKWVITGG